ncbi:thiamine-phosphate kinase [Hyphomonadaceae bacterium ML37]|nr:thiamine-phosphate kinase [Hyphomonadaceae bacterium ML37]
MSGGGEFDYIARRLAPLSAGCPGAAGLKDDGAVIAPAPGHELAVTSDTLISGVHFPADEDPALVAAKALRVNLSDLAAMGARARAYMLNVSWPDGADDALRERFADGLAAEQALFGVHLIGGDTTASLGPWMITITAFGELPIGSAVRRRGAQAGDLAVVTGTIGDAWLGLQARLGTRERLDAPHEDYLAQRFTRPEPRLSLVAAIRQHAHGAIDVSDGLLADFEHIAQESRLSLTLALEDIPLSPAALAWLEDQPDAKQARLELAAGGDDYELALAVAPPELEALRAAAEPLALTVVGRFSAGPPDLHVTWEGEPVALTKTGFTHF